MSPPFVQVALSLVFPEKRVCGVALSYRSLGTIDACITWLASPLDEEDTVRSESTGGSKRMLAFPCKPLTLPPERKPLKQLNQGVPFAVPRVRKMIYSGVVYSVGSLLAIGNAVKG